MSREAPASGADRNEYVDLLRGASIAAVVVGHWLLTAIQYRDGEFVGIDTLSFASWGSWVTLVLQVVPVFFLVGGYANARSWSRRSAVGGDWVGWVRLRMRRLLAPTTAYLVVTTCAVVIAELAGVSANNLYQAGWALAFQLWFLAAYVVLLVATPVLHAAHRRWGAAVPVAMGLAAVLISAVVVHWRWHLIGWANYVLVWGVFHQLGFAWYDGKFIGRRERAVALAVFAAAALAALIGWAGFPVSMVGVPGARIQNASPPSMALLMFGVSQCGVVMALEPLGDRWLARRAVARALARRGAAFSMAIYLWHMVPLVIVGVIGYPLGWVPQPPIGSGRWWAQHLVWIAVLIFALAAVLAILNGARSAWRRFSGFSAGVPVAASIEGRGGGLRALLMLAGVGVVGAAFGRLAVGGLAPNGHVDAAGLLTFALGSLLVEASSTGAPLLRGRKSARVGPVGARANR